MDVRRGGAASLGAIIRVIRDWWHAPTDYEQRVNFFAPTGALEMMRVVLFVGTSAWGLGIVAMQWTPYGPQSLVGRVVISGCAILAFGWTLTWLVLPWPSYRRSVVFVCCADVAIIATGSQISGQLGGFYVAGSLTTISLYLMTWDGAKALTGQCLGTLVMAIALAGRMAVGPQADIPLAVVQILLTVVMVVSPAVVQLAIWVLINHANESLTDPLTGALNRRGLYRSLPDIAGGDRRPGTVITVILIDLDLFKAVNDTYGHTVGDEVLVRSTERIVSVLDDGALLARIGGEEFAVVDASGRESATALAESIRTAISQPADKVPVTASVGATIMDAALMDRSSRRAGSLLDTALARADKALMQAKRTGRDRVIYLSHKVGH